MLDDEVMPILRRAAGKAEVIKSRVLHTWGYGEAQVAQLLDDLSGRANPSIAFLISDMDVGVRITAKSTSDNAAKALLAPVADEVRRRLGAAVFATDDVTNLDVLTGTLADQDRRVSVCEVGTAGNVAARLAEHDSAVFAGGVTLPADDITDAAALAERALDTFGSAVGVGVSAPELVDDSGQLASVFSICVITPEQSTTRKMRLFGTGERARSYAVMATHHLLRLAVSGNVSFQAWTEPASSAVSSEGSRGSSTT